MRKIAIILSGLLCCLFYETGGRGIPASVAEHAAVTISVDRASHDQWRCEREYNADLNLPRVAGKYLLPRSCPFPNAADPKPARTPTVLRRTGSRRVS